MLIQTYTRHTELMILLLHLNILPSHQMSHMQLITLEFENTLDNLNILCIFTLGLNVPQTTSERIEGRINKCGKTGNALKSKSFKNSLGNEIVLMIKQR